jgi:hypothetical protein
MLLHEALFMVCRQDDRTLTGAESIGQLPGKLNLWECPKRLQQQPEFTPIFISENESNCYNP